MECAAYRHCNYGRVCTITCPEYKPFVCKRRDRSPGACNGCSNYRYCRYDKFYYHADQAENEYRTQLVDTRVGFDLDRDTVEQIGAIIAPLLKNGLSPYQILQTHPEIPVCEKSLYTYIEDGVFSAFNIGPLDLRRQVSRRMPKKKAVEYKKREDRRYLQGRTYKDYVVYCSENPSASVVEMDTVYNDISNGPFIQTFKFDNRYPFFFGVYHDSKTADDMVAGVDLLDKFLGDEIFDRYMNVLLTDRGGEFVAADRFENRGNSTRRTRIFYCDPMQSGQKGSLENNHIQLRYILPKECDLKALGLVNQAALNLVLSHLNSVPSELLGGRTPFECLEFFAHDVYEKMLAFGIRPIPKDQICLKPYLLKQFR